MKNKMMVAGTIMCLALSGLAANAVAQNEQRGNGSGKGQRYGGPPQSQEERAARQADCIGVCPNGGPQAACAGERKGQGSGKGKAFRNGPRDGTGPRSANGTCPMNQAPVK